MNFWLFVITAIVFLIIFLVVFTVTAAIGDTFQRRQEERWEKKLESRRLDVITGKTLITPPPKGNAPVYPIKDEKDDKPKDEQKQ